MTPSIIIIGLFLGLASAVGFLLRSRNMHIWILFYIAHRTRQLFRKKPRHKHIYFCFADHYEPYWNGADQVTARSRVRQWMEKYPSIANRHHDSYGRHPRHTFFYPEEEYDPVILGWLKELCGRGFGDMEIHLHHDNDTAKNLEKKLVNYKNRLFDSHGFLRKDPATGEVVYLFIHGNWALDNSRPDRRWCGVDNELSVLVRTGCRCDMTMPSAPSATQTRKINSIYFAKGMDGRRKSHDTGVDAKVGAWGAADELLLVQGPLALNWRSRKFGIIPRIESGEISHDAPPTFDRARLWERCGISVQGAEEHVFIKVHTHGTEERTTQMLFDSGFDALWSALEKLYRDRDGYMLHYVTAWEMYGKIRQIALG